MKYVKSGTFTTQKFSISETITETNDVIEIAKDIIEKINNVPTDVKKELNLALANLNEAINYLTYIDKKTEIALNFVPKDIQEQEYL